MSFKLAFRNYKKSIRIKNSITKSFKDLSLTPLQASIKFTRSSLLNYDCEIYRDQKNRFTIHLTGMDIHSILINVGHKLECYVYWLSLCPADIEFASFCIDDGENASKSLFSPSSSKNDVFLVPDPHFFLNRGFSSFKHFSELNHVAWDQRRSAITWRGASNGPGRLDFSNGSELDQTVLSRLRLIQIGRKLDEFDAKFVKGNQTLLALNIQTHFNCVADPIPETDWINDKFAIDIDGWTNTWSNFIVRLHLGCCVLKVDSQFGYRQWYYDRIEPWKHFVPVKADMSDLAEKVDWVRTHDMEAKRIAENGQAFARTMTFESESRVAAEIITNAVRAAKRIR